MASIIQLVQIFLFEIIASTTSRYFRLLHVLFLRKLNDAKVNDVLIIMACIATTSTNVPLTKHTNPLPLFYERLERRPLSPDPSKQIGLVLFYSQRSQRYTYIATANNTVRCPLCECRLDGKFLMYTYFLLNSFAKFVPQKSKKFTNVKVICNNLCNFLAVCTKGIQFQPICLTQASKPINQSKMNAYLGLTNVKMVAVPLCVCLCVHASVCLCCRCVVYVCCVCVYVWMDVV